MVTNTEHSLLLQQLKNYLLFLRESGHTHAPLNSVLSELPVMAIPTFQDDSPKPLESRMTPKSTSTGPKDGGKSSTRLVDVREELGDCERCKLCETRQTIVFGSGNPTPT